MEGAAIQVEKLDCGLGPQEFINACIAHETGCFIGKVNEPFGDVGTTAGDRDSTPPYATAIKRLQDSGRTQVEILTASILNLGKRIPTIGGPKIEELKTVQRFLTAVGRQNEADVIANALGEDKDALGRLKERFKSAEITLEARSLLGHIIANVLNNRSSFSAPSKCFHSVILALYQDPTKLLPLLNPNNYTDVVGFTNADRERFRGGLAVLAESLTEDPCKCDFVYGFGSSEKIDSKEQAHRRTSSFAMLCEIPSFAEAAAKLFAEGRIPAGITSFSIKFNVWPLFMAALPGYLATKKFTSYDAIPEPVISLIADLRRQDKLHELTPKVLGCCITDGQSPSVTIESRLNRMQALGLIRAHKTRGETAKAYLNSISLIMNEAAINFTNAIAHADRLVNMVTGCAGNVAEVYASLTSEFLRSLQPSSSTAIFSDLGKLRVAFWLSHSRQGLFDHVGIKCWLTDMAQSLSFESPSSTGGTQLEEHELLTLIAGESSSARAAIIKGLLSRCSSWTDYENLLKNNCRGANLIASILPQPPPAGLLRRRPSFAKFKTKFL